MKRVVLVFLGVLALNLSVFAAGGGQQGPAAGSSAPMPITLGFWAGGAKFDADPVGQMINERFNVNITLVDQEWGDYEQVIRLWAASGQLPDTFSGYPGTETWFPDLVTQGAIRSVPETMINKYPNLKRVVDQTLLAGIMKDHFGGYYYLPRPESLSGMKRANNAGIYYRRDWAAKLGITDIPTDMETFYRMLDGFVNNDPDGNGRKDTYGFSASRLRSLYASFGAFEGRWVREPNGRVIPGYADEEPMVAALTWLRRAYKAGLIDSEFPQDYNVVAGKFVQGIFGAMDRSVGWDYTPPEYEDDPRAAVRTIASMSGVPGGTLYHDIEPDSSGYCFRADLSDEKLDKILEIVDWTLSPEGQDYQIYGIKDVDYRVNADGTYTMIKTPKTSYPSVWNLGNFALWPFDALLMESSIDTKLEREKKIDERDWYENPRYGASLGAVNALRDHIDLLATVISTEEKSLFPYTDTPTRDARLLEIISGDRDVRTMYREFITECNSRGMQAMIDSVNKAVKK
jgi:putative aldouronate transport system substrate-binding protein